MEGDRQTGETGNERDIEERADRDLKWLGALLCAVPRITLWYCKGRWWHKLFLGPREQASGNTCLLISVTPGQCLATPLYHYHYCISTASYPEAELIMDTLPEMLEGLKAMFCSTKPVSDASYPIWSHGTSPENSSSPGSSIESL